MDVLSSLKKIKGVSPITFEDKSFFQIAFPKDSIRYSQSWLYILRVSRGNNGEFGYKYVNNDCVAVIGYRNETFYVMPVVDETKGIEIKKLCQEIYSKTGKTIILRKIHISKEKEKVNEKKYMEDDFMPEKILQFNRLFLSASGTLNPSAINLIKKINAFENLNIELKVIESFHGITKQQLNSFFMTFPQKKASYLKMIEYLMTQKKNPQYKIMIFLNGKKIQGIYLGEVFSLKEMGLYCGLTAKEFPGETEWMDVFFFRKLFMKGINLLYLGGAENEGIANYIIKLIPYSTSYSISTIVFSGKKREKLLKVTMRNAKEDDFHVLASIYKNAYKRIEGVGEEWTHETARQLVAHLYHRQPDLFFVAEYKGKVIGAIVAAIQPWWDGNRLVEGEIFVDPHFQQKGVGKKLLRHLFLYARSKYGVVSWDTYTHKLNNHPLDWYKRIGFIEVPHWAMMSGDVATVLERLGE